MRRLAPKALGAYARGIWKHQIADHETGRHSRHAEFRRHNPGRGGEAFQDPNQYIRTWAEEYERSRDPMMLEAIDVMNARYERVYRHSEGLGLIGIAEGEGSRPATHLSAAQNEQSSRLVRGGKRCSGAV